MSGSAAARRAGSDPLPREVLERVRAREPEALGAFFERYVDQVFSLVYRLLGDRTLAEDVTQEVFLKVHRAAPQLDASRDPGPWLTTIATNACRDLWRSGAHRLRKKSDSLEDDSGLAERLTRHQDEPEGEAIARERERIVQQAIGELPEPLRLAVVLHDYQGLDHLEIARLTGLGHAAARKRYSRALEKLGVLLKERLR
ncbi:MAG TPA: RNA polymerase sigma factor [Candidatus Sulfotelmatobacter sp.]|nr:RNA polymerase sigma factor [Candidatus Sulfotelmatobacter sp.]